MFILVTVSYNYQYVYSRWMNYYSGIKKEGNIAISGNILDPWVDPEGILLSEMSDRKRQILYDLTYTLNMKETSS